MSFKNCQICTIPLATHPSCFICSILIGKGHENQEFFYWSKSFWVYNEYPQEKIVLMDSIGMKESDDEIILPNIWSVPRKMYHLLALGWTEKRKRVNTKHKKLLVCTGCHRELESGRREECFNKVYAHDK